MKLFPYSFLKETTVSTNIKPPDLWIHHDQMELKALQNNLNNAELTTNGSTNNTLPRSSIPDYNKDNSYVNNGSSSLDKRSYIHNYNGTFQ